MMHRPRVNLYDLLLRLDRRIVYVLVLVALTIPLVINVGMFPAEMPTAEMVYDTVEALPTGDGKVVWIAMDWGPSTQAENMPQTAILMEHLMRRKIPFCTFSITYIAEPFMKSLPQRVADRLNAENAASGIDYRYEYGQDWANIGYRPAPVLFVRGLAKSQDISAYLAVDARGTPMREVPCMAEVTTIHDFTMLAEFTGLVGAFNIWIQFFQTEDYRPKFVHGCTSITIPEAFIYLDSGQIQGLLEGVAGAAYYSQLVQGESFDPIHNPDLTTKFMMSLSLAHLVIIFFILLGNLGLWLQKRPQRRQGGAA